VGVYLASSTQSVIQSNKVAGGQYAFVIVDAASAGSNTITKNTISNEGCGMSKVQVVADILSPNTYLTTGTLTCQIV